jgi:hypothetical protein
MRKNKLFEKRMSVGGVAESIRNEEHQHDHREIMASSANQKQAANSGNLKNLKL